MFAMRGRIHFYQPFRSHRTSPSNDMLYALAGASVVVDHPRVKQTNKLEIRSLDEEIEPFLRII